MVPILLISQVLFGCAATPQPHVAAALEYSQSGKASYYADRYQNKPTASGALYDKNAMTAAHRKLPFGTMVKVTNTSNGKSVLVKITDRGPYSKGLIIDLSRAAFSTIGNTEAGILEVTIEVVQ